GVALLLFLLTTFLGPIVVLSSWNFIQERVNVYCIALLLLETAILGTLASLDLVLFYVFWEAMLIPMYLLIGMWGSDRRIYAGVMLKMGTFGFIRYAMPLFPQAALAFAPAIAVLGVIGIVYGSLMCMAQTDLKRLIAYSSVAHLGFVMLGLSALTPEAVSGA